MAEQQSPNVQPSGAAAALQPGPSRKQWLDTNSVTFDDLTHALSAGAGDLRRGGRFSLFFGLVYALGGLALVILATRYSVPWLIYPLAMGFVLVAPFAAMGLYDISRRLEDGQPLTWSGVLGSIRLATKRDMRWMALITGFTFIIWMDMAALLTFGFLGLDKDFNDFLKEVFTTERGLLFLLVGNVAGALIAAAVYSFTVMSFPLLYDRDIDFVTAMVTSVRLVMANPLVMGVWALIIGALVGLSILTAFVGLLVVLPLLGHATWHLYRRAIPRSAS